MHRMNAHWRVSCEDALFVGRRRSSTLNVEVVPVKHDVRLGQRRQKRRNLTATLLQNNHICSIVAYIFFCLISTCWLASSLIFVLVFWHHYSSAFRCSCRPSAGQKESSFRSGLLLNVGCVICEIKLLCLCFPAFTLSCLFTVINSHRPRIRNTTCSITFIFPVRIVFMSRHFQTVLQWRSAKIPTYTEGVVSAAEGI